jgi:hypothetical protein
LWEKLIEEKVPLYLQLPPGAQDVTGELQLTKQCGVEQLFGFSDHKSSTHLMER